MCNEKEYKPLFNHLLKGLRSGEITENEIEWFVGLPREHRTTLWKVPQI